ncbi:hypothetical protein Bca52824_009277 [Brassica carinata]|uniref:Arf-GAP domain-containing protein n=1 Tax=Brassica carinata TaxID=52824 RepID=A0A8X7W9L5_BRACI|nr:hypothetical protein Bca52824_009277 [Brassica carinata]
MAAARRLRMLQSHPENKVCVDCSQKIIPNGQCSGKHRGLSVHISFVRSITMDSWSEIQIKKMESGGNERLNSFLASLRDLQGDGDRRQVQLQRGVGVSRSDPGVGAKEGQWGWDDWDNDDAFRSPRRNQYASDFRAYRGGGGGGGGGGAPAKSKSSEDIYSRSQFEASAANKESFFAKRMAENECKPEGLPPSQGGKYVGFGSSSGPAPRSNQQSGGGGDVLSAVSEGFRRLSLVATSAANVVQTGTMEFISKVKEGGLDNTVSETVNVVANKTT